MNYILCSVLWADCEQPPGFDINALYAVRLDKKGGGAEYGSFLEENYNSSQELIKDFLGFCGEEFMLGVWDGSSAGRIKRLLDMRGFRHPYVHLYQLCRVYELSQEKCRDIQKRRLMQSKLEKKPFYYEKRAAAENETKWLASVFGLMDLSVMKKKPAVDFTEQPSNKYFVFKNGKCFHTNECGIVKGAPVSALRAYTYYSKVTDAGFAPCMRCKPENNDEETASVMREINAGKKKEARAEYAAGKRTPKRRRRKKLDVYRSLAHMCGMYGLKYEKSGKNVYITSGAGKYRISPEDEKTELFVLSENGEYISEEKIFDDPYKAVREIVRVYENTKKQPAVKN